MILKLTKIYHNFGGNVKEKAIYINSNQILCLDKANPEDAHNTTITMAVPNDNDFDKYFHVKEKLEDVIDMINNISAI